MAHDQGLSNLIYGALYGVAAGDALGAPLEFMSASQIAHAHGTVRDMLSGGWLNVKPGEITDDTQMTVAVAQGILDDPEHPVEAAGKHFLDWYATNPKDVGVTCSMSIHQAKSLAKQADQKLPNEEDWKIASEDTHQATNGKSAGNGTLMRTVYVGLYYTHEEEIKKHAMGLSAMTHHDPQAGQACAAYCLVISALLNNPGRETLVEELERVKPLIPYYDYRKLTDPCFKPIPSGYVVESFKAALHAILTTATFEDALVKAINLGGDADTIGAIAGGLAGALYGKDQIPQRWLDSLLKTSAGYMARLDAFAEAAIKKRLS
ncbi:MAG: ADP-ribosylglycohydrolase family protein [Bacillota bacterium]|nr:ADP-ribosylglycohydrolase family protein [Bacillota bacterium]